MIECCDGQRSHVLKGQTDLWNTKWTYAARLENVWGIDSTVLRLNNDNYFVWYSPRPPSIKKRSTNPKSHRSRFSPRSKQSLYIARLLTPTFISTPQLLSEPTNAWETVGGAVNEGPAPLYHGGKTWIVFSASYCWGASYQLGLLTYKGGEADPLKAESWTKKGPVFSSANGNYGTGHNG